MQNIILVVLLILALCLIVTVLMQRSEGGGLGIGGGGGGNMSGRPPASPVAKFTWILGAGFMAACLALTVISARDTANQSVLSGGVTQTDGATTPSTGGLTGDLLPPSAEDAPAAPPKADD